MNWNNRDIYGGICWEEESLRRINDKRYLDGFGYKVYSQNDEDGIIAEIFRRIGAKTQIFVEFGVQNGLECNSHYLLHKGWRGLFIEGEKSYCDEMKIRFKPVIKNKKLVICNRFICRNNIDDIISDYYKGEIEFLSIDIDGNDYYVWEAVKCICPRVVCIEYNGKFPPDLDWKQAYDSEHVWDGSDWHGASLLALERLGREKGYILVGTNLNGANAFFVKADEAEEKFPYPHTAKALFNPIYNLGISFKAEHKARWCLVDQKEELGLGNYIENPDELYSLTKLTAEFMLPDFPPVLGLNMYFHISTPVDQTAELSPRAVGKFAL